MTGKSETEMAKALVAKVEDESTSGKMKALPGRTRSFLNDVRNEMRKVTVPSRKEVQATTAVVLVTVFIFAGYFWVVDGIIGKTLDWAFRTLVSR
jgi:preprotein translocase subunit SecE